MRRPVLLFAAGGLALAIVIGGIACGDDDKDDNGDGTPAAATATEAAGEPTEPAAGTPEAGAIDVNLVEYIVAPRPGSATAGTVTFNARNTGGEPHELVVIKTDLDEHQLPTNADGSVDEAGAGIEVIGEIPEFPNGEERTASFDLEAGAYVLICNVVTEPATGEPISHYAEDMHSAFTVTE
jgi:hypothetical protein